jgi:hypothetical protein
LRIEQILKRQTGKADSQTCKVIGSLVTEAKDGIKDAGG